MIFELHFLNDDIGKVKIDEPIGYNTLQFDFMQKPKGLARDISFNGGEIQLEFVHTREHYLSELLYYFNHFGFESKVNFLINGEVIGDLDFAKAETDGLEYLKCKVIQDGKLQIVKRRSKVKVDLFATKDLDGQPIDPVVPTSVLVKAKAVFQTSEWESSDYINFVSEYGYNAVVPFNNILKSEISDTLTFLNPSGLVSNNDYEDYICIEAKENLKNININIFELELIADFFLIGSISGYAEINFIIIENNVEKNILNIPYTINENANFFDSQLTFKLDKINITHKINLIKRGEKIFIGFKIKQIKTGGLGASARLQTRGKTKLKNISITAESTSYNSITKGVRLYDAMKQNIKSISGLNCVSPKFNVGGEFYNNYLVNGNLLRNITDKPFEISLDQIEESLPEMNADFEVNDSVFFGTYDEFYRNEECGFFDNTQFSEFTKKFNEKYSVNTINYKYKNYQSLKENEQPNTSDTIHGETSMLFSNKMVENTKEISVEWIRDSFLIEEARAKSIEITDGTAYQNDDNLFILDCLPNTEDLSFTERSDLKHEWNGTNLILRSDKTLNFTTIGLFVGARFEILAPDKNTGVYQIHNVFNQEVQLIYISGGNTMTTSNDGVRFTEYIYTIPQSEIPFITRTNQSIVTSNISSPETFNNLLYSVKRNLINYYGAYMATCNLYNKAKNITSTTYKHNGKAQIQNGLLTTIENQDVLPSNPILSPYIYENMVYSNVDFDDFISLQKQLRSKRGFVRSIDKVGNPIKVYPTKMTYKDLDKELTIVGEEKHQQAILNIETSQMFTTINNETKVSSLKWSFEGNELSVFDRAGYRLYRPVYWHSVAINGALSETKNILEERLKLIK